jgi:predicted phosphodiesterase
MIIHAVCRFHKESKMKVLVISDIHGNIDSLRAVEAEEKEFDAVLCAGDVVDWGWNPCEVVDWLRDHNAIVVAGNHDRAIVARYDNPWREPVGQETSYASHIVNQLTIDRVEWLRALPEQQIVTLDGVTYCMRHAVVIDETSNPIHDALRDQRSIPYFHELWERFVGNFDEHPVRRLLFGHSHRCYLMQAAKNEMYLNPGSMHYRMCADAATTGADYIVIRDGIAEMKHVDYPTAHLRRRIEMSNFPEEIRRPALVYARSAVD